MFSPFAMSGLMVFILLVSACSSDPISVDSRTAVSAFLNGNEEIVAFGSIDIDEILMKAKYDKVPKLGVLLGGELKSLKEVIDLDEPVYYAIQGPMDQDGVPAATYAFLKVKDQDKFVDKLVQRGYDINTDSDIKSGQDEGFAIGIRGELAIVVAKTGDFDGKKMLADAFKKTQGEAAEQRVNKILDSKGDFVLGVSMASLYATSNTDLSSLSEDKQKELKKMVDGSFVQTTVRFENGAAVLETKNYFSKKLKERMFMNADANAPLLAKLGSGTPRMGIAMNIDMKKLNNFLREFSPDAVGKLASTMGGPAQMALIAGGSDGLAGLFDGRMGFVAFGEGDDEPAFNVFIGLKKNGLGLAEMAKDIFSSSPQAIYNVGSDGASLFTNAAFGTGGQLKLPQGCENFGKSGISGFISFEGLNFDDLDLEGEENMIRAIKYITVEYNNDGGRIYVKARKGQENVLEQMMKELLSAMTDEIGNISI
ncbi:MAG: hypothetical protein A3D92_21480 [Bacteroidetes bacterium RIFCSPHIGHO2_02_FULL_44_7]|nr:MAG: hypothetical protein A3D92_21480 [Bacteroidetes bacterium RIFCSPHIGHO2_02_FULL_44_7]